MSSSSTSSNPKQVELDYDFAKLADVRADLWRGAVQRDLAAREHHASAVSSSPLAGLDAESVLQAQNCGHDLRTYFTSDGVQLAKRTERTPRGGSRSRWSAWAGAGARDAGGATLLTNGNRVTYDRGDLTEWYVNDPRGLEQGFDLARRPAGPASAPLPLALAVGVIRPIRRGVHEAAALR